jgi:hypothetical protein
VTVAGLLPPQLQLQLQLFGLLGDGATGAVPGCAGGGGAGVGGLGRNVRGIAEFISEAKMAISNIMT